MNMHRTSPLQVLLVALCCLALLACQEEPAQHTGKSCVLTSGKGTSCTTTEAKGVCMAGTLTCKDGSLVCAPGPEASQVCNGKDDNCNGVVDEADPLLGVQCSVGKKGQCPGIFACKGGKLVCKSPNSATEVCNDRDDDCDGNIDNGFSEKGKPCSAGKGACKALGTKQCDTTQTKVECNAKAVPNKKSETCDGTDEDCNGNIDNGLSPPGATLAAKCDPKKVAACVCKGLKKVCAGAGGWKEPDLSSVAGYEQVEVSCDSKDNDCDGLADEGGVCKFACSADVKKVETMTNPYRGSVTSAQPSLPSCTAVGNTLTMVINHTVGQWQVCESKATEDLSQFDGSQGILEVVFEIKGVTQLRGALNLWYATSCNKNKRYLKLIPKNTTKAQGEHTIRFVASQANAETCSPGPCADAGPHDTGVCDGGAPKPPSSLFKKAKLMLIHERLDQGSASGTVELKRVAYYPNKGCLCTQASDCHQSTPVCDLTPKTITGHGICTVNCP